MFKGNQTKDHFLSCDRPIFLILTFPFYFLHLSFFFLHFPTFCRIISKHFSHLPFNIGILFLLLRQGSILHNLRTVFLLHMPPSVEGDPWSGFRKEIIRLKRGNKWIIFILVKGQRKMVVCHFKHSYLTEE